jgi:hypothetical protein
MKGLTISRITISIAMGTALVMGALMDGPTKPLANQAFAATPCSLTVGNEGTTTISGKLVCGGQGLGHATIHLTLHHITTGRTTTATAVTEIPDGSYDHAVVLGAGHSYTADAKYDGDSDHQPAFATTSINIPGPTGSTQGTSNAGNGQGTSNAGNGQQNNSTQASVTVPCSLTVGTPPDEVVPASIEGKLICGGLGEPRATIQISGLPGGSDSTTTTNGGSYELGVFSPFSPGQSYTVTAKYDGDSNQHLQPASATTIINIKGSTGSTQDNNNAGSTPQNNNAGSTPQNNNAGSTPQNNNAGSTPQNNNAGNGQDTSNAGNGQDTSNAGNGQDTNNAGNGQDTSNVGNSAG